ncbi:uncharacterized protein DC041_0004243 [Schistosoma bovis]|uniref:TRAF3-interacting protein 1 N-terminal domain-containing protein n=1 Tax=Schistosoma bovis TaxID=6184 RepID=A0A430QMF4_SCHBO|nr:uncharacterized protein DC041_0004243 [Schistosoma bovis]
MCEVDVKIIKRTQETLGKLIKKPVLTEKLLSRPPFRFLHDICTSVIRSTGLMKGLFNSEELEADNVKDKDKKLAFLQKLINNEEYVARVLQGSKVDDVKSSAVGKQVSETKHSKKKPGMESKFVDHRTKVTQSRRKNKSNGEKVNEIENKLFVYNNKVLIFYTHVLNRSSYGTETFEDSTDPVNVEKCGSARENHLFQDSGSRAGSQCGLQTPEKSQEEIVAPSLQNSEVSVFQPRHHRPASAKGQRVKRDGSCLTSFCFYVF